MAIPVKIPVFEGPLDLLLHLVNQAQVDIREVLEMALRRKASGVILVHNHPGGSERASAPDLTITQRLKFLANNMGLRLLDHIIVTDKGYVSLCEQNLL